MEIKKLECPNCGAPLLEIDPTTEAFVCKFCSSIIAVDMKKPNQTETVDMELPSLRKVEPELRYMANLRLPAADGSHQKSLTLSQGGHLWITKDEVVFKPHSLNIGPLNKSYIRIQDVVGYKKFLTTLSIFTKSGHEMALVTWKNNEIINEIETRRKNYFISHNLPIPPLQY